MPPISIFIKLNESVARDGDLTMVKAFLLCDHVDVNNNYEFDETPLYIASRESHEDIVHALLTDPRQGGF